MIMMQLILLFLLLFPCTGFTLHPSPIATTLKGQVGVIFPPHPTNGITLFMSSEDDNNVPKKRRRRKKVETDIKGATGEAEQEDQVDDDDAEADTEDQVVAETLVDLQPRARAPVTLAVKDVRGLVGGASSAQVTSVPATVSNKDSPPVTTDVLLQAPTDRTAPDDAFAQLLRDAERMKEESGDNGGGDESLKVKARNILSTIVTADFFVVCGFLLWFLAGIGFRAVFNDDSVQIAFNSKIRYHLANL